jgi:hypothetical protein
MTSLVFVVSDQDSAIATSNLCHLNAAQQFGKPDASTQPLAARAMVRIRGVFFGKRIPIVKSRTSNLIEGASEFTQFCFAQSNRVPSKISGAENNPTDLFGIGYVELRSRRWSLLTDAWRMAARSPLEPFSIRLNRIGALVLCFEAFS